MKTFFQEKQIVINNAEGEKLEFFMRPIKIKELQIINRIAMLSEGSIAEEFSTPLLLSLMLDCLSIDGKNIPVEATETLVSTFLEYNFPDIGKDTFEESDRSQTKKKNAEEPLSFYIDFLINQGHTVSDIMEMTLPQFNELVLKAGERLCPEKKVLDPLTVFRKMGIPIRKGNKGTN